MDQIEPLPDSLESQSISTHLLNDRINPTYQQHVSTVSEEPMKPRFTTHSIPFDQDPNVSSKLKQFKRLPRRMSSFLRQGLLSIAVLTAVVGASSQSIAQTLLPNNTLFPGEQGARVFTLQQALRSEGFFVSVDGVYGPETVSAVTQFQRSCGLIVDGIAGPQTNNALASGTCSGFVPIQPPFIPVQPPTSGLPVGPFVAVIPGDDPSNLATARQVQAAATVQSSRRGSFINAGGYEDRERAEAVVDQLRNRRLSARVEYRP